MLNRFLFLFIILFSSHSFAKDLKVCRLIKAEVTKSINKVKKLERLKKRNQRFKKKYKKSKSKSLKITTNLIIITAKLIKYEQEAQAQSDAYSEQGCR